MGRRRRPSESFTDDQLMAFVMWCRLNDDRITSMPELCRRVLDAYAGHGSPPAKGVAHEACV